MKTVFVDTNIILDVLLQNEGLWQDSARIFRLAEHGELQACVSASSLTDVFYIARKRLTVPVARAAIGKLLDLFTVVGVDADDLRGALSLPIADVEDALQAWCAKKVSADTLITRNVNDFPGIGIPIVSPADFSA